MRKFIILLCTLMLLLPGLSYASDSEPVTLPWIKTILSENRNYNVEYDNKYKYLIVHNVKDNFRFFIGIDKDHYMRMCGIKGFIFSNKVTEEMIHKISYELAKETPMVKVKRVNKKDKTKFSFFIEIQTFTDKNHFLYFFTAYEDVLRNAVEERLVKKAIEVDQS